MDGFINLNKTVGPTSFDCVAKLRKILSTKKIGHAGTLDPDACGVLPIAVGKATRLLEFVTADEKHYAAEATFGQQTTTQDASGEVIQTIDSSHLSEKDILAILPVFHGEIKQIPPMYSAIRINGKRLYELARQNIEVERQPRMVTIRNIELIDFKPGNFPKAFLRITCSKGTYIRTLIQDIGEKLGTTGHMSYLQRIRVGEFALDNSVTLEEISTAIANKNISSFLLPLSFPLTQLGGIHVDEKAARRIMHGNKIPLDPSFTINNENANIFCVYYNSRLLAVATLKDKEIVVEKVLLTEGEQK